MRAHYAMWHERLEDRRFVASLPPAVEWETGVFAETLPAGVMREVRQAIIERPRGAVPVRMHLVVERHPGTTHVCAIQRTGCGASVTNHLSMVAAWVAERYLPRPGLLGRLGRSRHRLVFHHTTAPARLGPPQQLVWAHALRWGRKGVRTCQLETQEATPYLRTLSLELIPGLGSDMVPD